MQLAGRYSLDKIWSAFQGFFGSNTIKKPDGSVDDVIEYQNWRVVIGSDHKVRLYKRVLNPKGNLNGEWEFKLKITGTTTE